MVSKILQSQKTIFYAKIQFVKWKNQKSFLTQKLGIRSNLLAKKKMILQKKWKKYPQSEKIKGNQNNSPRCKVQMVSNT